jgi:hypothetical protein
VRQVAESDYLREARALRGIDDLDRTTRALYDKPEITGATRRNRARTADNHQRDQREERI